MFGLMKPLTSSKMGHVWSKTTSQGLILEKPCVNSRDQIFSLIIMKLGQNDFLDKILDTLYSHNFSQIILKLGQNFCLE